ncbi:MAG: hypothetical protein JOZ82_05540 [Marmoricola sp.]|nr:hypothetical protein [Marmoricola sp.]
MSPKVSTDESQSRQQKLSAAQYAVRTQAARAIRIIFGIFAAILALGAVLIVLQSNINLGNSIVKFVLDTAETLSGPFSRTDGIFHFTGKNADAKNALLNWGIAAIVYLVIGRVLANLIAPRSASR